MIVTAFLEELRSRDIRVWADGDQLRCSAPTGVLTPELRNQLRERKADADQLTIEQILNENRGDSHVAGVVFARRTSNTLRRLGFAEGIQPKLAAKVVVFYEPTRIIGFGNGLGGGDQNFCRPE